MRDRKIRRIINAVSVRVHLFNVHVICGILYINGWKNIVVQENVGKQEWEAKLVGEMPLTDSISSTRKVSDGNHTSKIEVIQATCDDFDVRN